MSNRVKVYVEEVWTYEIDADSLEDAERTFESVVLSPDPNVNVLESERQTWEVTPADD